jgi:hypothetical protein
MIVEAILKINPKAVVRVDNGDIDKIEWLENTKPISKTKIQSKIKELEDEKKANGYQMLRRNEYPSIQDQLDDIYHNGIDGWKETIKAVKDKYPKG